MSGTLGDDLFNNSLALSVLDISNSRLSGTIPKSLSLIHGLDALLVRQLSALLVMCDVGK